MSSTHSAKPDDFGASDVLVARQWALGQAGMGLGLDVACTKAAVDLQNLTRQTIRARHRGKPRDPARGHGADAAFLAMLDPTGTRIRAKSPRRGHRSRAAPGALAGRALADLPFLASRFDHLRLTEYRDTALPRREDPAEAQRLAALGIRLGAAGRASMPKRRPAGVLAVARAPPRVAPGT